MKKYFRGVVGGQHLQLLLLLQLQLLAAVVAATTPAAILWGA